MKNSKKGVTLIELMCAMAVIVIAVSVGFQLYYVSAKAYANSTLLDENTKAAVQFFESADDSALQEREAQGASVTVTKTAQNPLTVTLGGVPLRDTGSVLVQAQLQSERTKTALSILKNSIGKGKA